MSMELYSHNQAAYEAVRDMLAVTGKAAVIHPTGTGKSYIGFKLCADNPDKTICWLSPSDYIYQTQVENLVASAPDISLDNVKYFTYARLMNMTEQEISEIQPDYIIMDEFHRCGAELWGLGVKHLLDTYPNAKLLGLSATAIRYLDNQRDMADELFGGNVASEMTLGEAIVRGILNPPKYVLAIYSYQKCLEKYEQRVRNTRNKAVRDKAEKILRKLRRMLDNAEGLDVVFDKHMTDRAGKYIVFCSNFKAMKNAINNVGKWFGKVDEAPHIYSLYSMDTDSEKEFEQFKADADTEHLKLLFCIDALNEGVNVENVPGVILLRPTVSPIVYKQQIGRALSAAKKTVPVIFDVVNNIEYLYSIDSIKEEMQEAVNYFREYDSDDEIINESFDITDELLDCLEVFHKLEATLSASWDVMFDEARRYAEENGDLLVPGTYITDKGYSLGAWISNQRQNYKQKIYLTSEQIARLESIGMCWNAAERLWNERYERCNQYFQLYHSLDGIKGYSVQLYDWLIKQRIKYRQGQLEPEKIELLEQLGIIWDMNEIWEQYFAAAKLYYEQNGHLDIPAAFVTEDDVQLGHWFRTMRKAYQLQKMSEDKIQRLEAIGMKWDSLAMRKWLKNYELAKQYYAEHGDSDINVKYICDDGTRLGVWVSSQREQYKNGELSEEQIELLEKLNFSWGRYQSLWEQSYEYARKFAEKGGDLNTLPSGFVFDGFKLFSWIWNQRGKYKNRKLSEEQIAKLESLGIQWQLNTSSWEDYYAHAREYFLEHDDLAISQKYISPDGCKLGAWIGRQRNSYAKEKLDNVRIERLEMIGMIWSTQEQFWETGIAHAKAYFAKYGDLNTPNKYVCDDGYSLGEWLTSARKKYSDGAMPQEQINALESLGIVWDRQIKSWENGFAHAKDYFDTHGNLDISGIYVCNDGYKLGEWRRAQFRRIARGTMPIDRMQMLQSIGISEARA